MENPNVFANVSRDEDMDLSKFIPSNNVETNSQENTNNSTTIIKSNSNLSPLEKELERQKNESLGMSITKEQFESGKEQTQFRSVVDSDERREAMEQAQTDADMLLKQREAIIPLKASTTQQEYIQMVHEISLVRFDENDKAYIQYDKDANGNNIALSMIRLRTENDPPYSKENDLFTIQHAADNAERVKNGLAPITNINNVKDTTVDSESDDDIKKNTVKLIIDKTGLGANIDFTPEERQKLVESNEIHLTQVQVLDIASITTVKPDRESFAGKIHEYSLSGSKTTISFPASGFKADMLGLTYGEIGDISLSMDSVNTDKYYKRLAIIYNKMKNISTGPFDSFEDFLKKFAYTDIPLALYGLYVSTFPEVQTLTLRCGRDSCGKTFDWNFSTRNILKLEKSDEVFLDHMSKIAVADPNEYDEIQEKAPVNNIKYIKLPNCGYIVGLGIASCWDFLYNFIPVLDEDTFKSAFGDDLNQVYMNNVLLLTTVLSVRVPDIEHPGTYILCEGYKDILDAIYNISPEEIKILASISSKLQKEYQVYFSLGDVSCPHCQNITSDMEVQMDDLVFQTYQRLISTEVDLTNIRGL